MTSIGLQQLGVGGIDEHSGRLHQGQIVERNGAACFGQEAQMQAEEIAFTLNSCWRSLATRVAHWRLAGECSLPKSVHACPKRGRGWPPVGRPGESHNPSVLPCRRVPMPKLGGMDY